MHARYMECSSKEMDGVDQIFDKALDIVVANDRSNTQKSSRNTDSRASQVGFGGGGGGDGLVPKRRKRKCNFL